jgi:hypothetical protein
VAGSRFRVATIVLVTLGLGCFALLVYAAVARETEELLLLATIAFILMGAIATVLFVQDVGLVARDRPGEPDTTLKSYLKAMAFRPGHAWATLCPTAREQTVEAPSLGEVQTGHGAFSLSQPGGLKAYAGTFARPGGGTMHQMAIKRVSLEESDGEVAVVEVHAIFQSWPLWINIVIGVSAVVFRLALIVAAILYFVMRKREERTFRKTLLRANDGVWYVYDADLLEGD